MNDESVSAEAQAPIATEHVGENTQVATEKASNVEINWQRANEALKAQSQELRQLRAELDSYRTAQQHQKGFKGKDKDDIPTYGELEEFVSERERTYQASLQELKTKSQFPDFDSVVTKYGKNLPESMKRAILNSPDPHLAAYEACKSSDAYYKDQLANTQHNDAKRVADNLQKPGSASAAGTSAALGKASYYESLSEREILEMSNRFMRG